MGVEHNFNNSQDGEFTSSTADALKGVQTGAEAEDIWGDADEVAALAKEQANSKRSVVGKFLDRRAAKKVAQGELPVAAVQPAGEAGPAIDAGSFDQAAWDRPIDPATEGVWDEPIPGGVDAQQAETEAKPVSQDSGKAKDVNWDEKF